VQFEARVGSAPVACGQQYEGVGSAASTVEVRDLRLYVSNVVLTAADGSQVPLELVPDGLWQTSEVALLDFEDGSGACNEAGTAELRDRIVGRAPAGDYTGIAFDLGVPFEANHLDATLADSPLNVSAMYWAWQSGYKFLRLDLGVGAGPDRLAWPIHIGSSGCTSASPVVAPTTACGAPNRARVQLSGFDPTSGAVVFDLAELLSETDLTGATEGSPPGCMAAPNDKAECAELFSSLGMSFDSGACEADCAAQRAFRGEP
jgi:uncharacterized repeat protein (TIGR04052 family)